jgi:hypothetical protein
MKVIFKAIPSGDYECFCFDVDRETFKRLTKHNPNKHDKSTFNKGLYKIYPFHLFGHEDRVLKFSIEVEKEEKP